MKWKSGVRFAQRLLLATVTALSYSLCAAAAATDLPVYPAAKTHPLRPGMHAVVGSCGHAFTVEKSMTVDADPHAIATWYQRRLPGSHAIDLSRLSNDEAGGGSYRMTSIEVVGADGTQIVVVNRMSFDRALVNASKSIGADKAQIGIESVSPPLAPGYIALSAQMAAGGASARKAKQQMEAMCKG